MDISQLMKTNTPYCAKHGQIKPELQLRAKELVWEYNQTRPSEAQKRHAILKQLLVEPAMNLPLLSRVFVVTMVLIFIPMVWLSLTITV